LHKDDADAEEEKSKMIVEQLHMRPFLLRRVQADVEKISCQVCGFIFKVLPH
jgi:hypothetical protein